MEKTFNRIFGEFLGYPDCCIKAFGDQPMLHMYRPKIVQENTSNGFVPCESCAQKIASKEITFEGLINPNRKCSVPFKSKNVHTEDREQIREELLALKAYHNATLLSL